MLNLKSGNVFLTYKLPSAVITDLPVILYYNSNRSLTTNYGSGVGWSSLFDQYLTPFVYQDYKWDVDRTNGSGSVATYYENIFSSNPATQSFEYIPSQDNSNTLAWDHTTDEWTETQPNGTRLHYALTSHSTDWDGSWKHGYGSLSRISTPAGSVWTITRNVSGRVSTVLSPFSRRTTFSYDGSNNLKRIQDGSGRITSFTIDGSSRLTAITTPELCQTGFGYSGYHINSWINPAGDRTTFTYVGADYQAGRITAPDGGITTLTYSSSGGSNPRFTNTRVDALGRKSTYIFDPDSAAINAYGPVWRHTINPLGIRTTYTSNIVSIFYPGHKRGFLSDGLGNRTTFTYLPVTYTSGNAQPARLGSVALPHSNRFTYLYDDSFSDNYRVKGLIDQSGAVSTLVWDGNGNRIAFVDALLRRTSYSYNSFGQMTAVKNPLGQITTYAYNSLGQRTAVVDPLGNRTTYAYSQHGQIRRVTNPLGQSTTYVRDLMNRVTAEINPRGYRTTYSYDLNGRLYRVLPPSLHPTTTIYDSMGRVRAQVNPLGYRTSYAYDLVGNRKRMQDATGAITTFVYDDADRQIATVDAYEKRTTYVYDKADNRIATVNPLGHRMTTVFDPARRPIAIVDPQDNRTSYSYDKVGRQIRTKNPLQEITTSVYNKVGELRASVDPLAHRTTFAYDLAGRQVHRQNAHGYIHTTVYDAAGRGIASVDPLLYRTTNVLDGAGRTKATINALGDRTSYTYDATGNRTVVVNPRGARTTYVYLWLNQPVQIRDPAGGTSLLSYDGAGQRITYRDPNIRLWRYNYDPLGRPNANVNPLLDRTTYVFDRVGRRVATLDPELNRVTTAYDVASRPIAQVDGNGHRTTMVYDSRGLRTAVVDARANRTSFSYDAAGRLIEQKDPLLRRTTFSYDAAGRQTERQDARGVLTTYVYDEVNQLTGRRYSDGARVTFSYDPVGSRSTMDDPSGSYSYAYDALSRISVFTDRTGERLTHTYDSASNPLTLEGSTGVVTYKYDIADRCVGYDNPRTTWTYNAGGLNLAQFNTNGTRTSFSYDGANRLLTVTNRLNPSSVMSDYAVKYDKAGNRTRVTNNAGGLVTTYLYDKAYQLTADYTTVDRNTYVYDPIGNRQVFRRADGSVATYTYDVANQMTRILDAGVPTTLTYDQAGNPLRQRNIVQPFNVTMVWDAESRMTSYHQTGVSGGNSFNQQLTHEYNGDGQRVVRQSGGVVAQYVWDGQNICLKLDGGGSVADQYHYQPQTYGRLFASGSYWHHYDPLGSTTNLTTSSGLQAVYRYGAWGSINYAFTNGSVVDPFLFVGEQGYYTDDEGIDKNDTSPLLPCYVRARFYNPKWGRWLNQDPINQRVADSNLYRYVNNASVTFVDPSGLVSVSESVDIGFVLPIQGTLSGLTLSYTDTIDSCCRNGVNGSRLTRDMTWHGEVGLGAGGEVKFLGYKLGLMFKTVSAEFNFTGKCSTPCTTNPTTANFSCCKSCFDIGVNIPFPFAISALTVAILTGTAAASGKFKICYNWPGCPKPGIAVGLCTSAFISATITGPGSGIFGTTYTFSETLFNDCSMLIGSEDMLD